MPVITTDVSIVCCLSVSRENNYRCHGDYWVSYQVTNQAHDGIVLIDQTTSTGHRITKNNRLNHLGEMPGVGGRFARVGGFSPT